MKYMIAIMMLAASTVTAADLTASSTVLEQVEANDPSVYGQRTRGAATMARFEDYVLPAAQVKADDYNDPTEVADVEAKNVEAEDYPAKQ